MAALPNWSEEEWAEAIERLTLYAYRKLARLYWRGLPPSRGGAVPGGLEPADIAAQAAVDAIEGRRNWDADAEPDFLRFLYSVVDSRVSHLVGTLENRMTRCLGAGDPDESQDPPGVANCEEDPALACANRESLEKFRAAVLAAIEGDKLAIGIFQCLEAEITKPAEIAEYLEVPVKEVNNAQKRLRRKVEGVLKEHGQR